MKITDDAQLWPAEARRLIRSGAWTRPTTGLASGYVQANLVIVPRSWAEEFELFCHRNPQAAPLLDRTEPGDPRPATVAPAADLRSDIPRYRVYRRGELAEEPEHIYAHWQDDFVAFLLGCSFSVERALFEHGVPLRHIEQGKNVAMYRTGVPCVATTRLHGPLVVSMRPIKREMVDSVVQITAHYPRAHGAPIHVGDPAQLGIDDLGQPDWGDAIDVEEGEVPVFWACGVTPQAVIIAVKPEIAITHAPGHMFITDWPDSAIYQ